MRKLVVSVIVLILILAAAATFSSAVSSQATTFLNLSRRTSSRALVAVIELFQTPVPAATPTPTIVPTPTVVPTATPQPIPKNAVLRYQIDRTAVPLLSFNDLTLKIFVGPDAQVEAVAEGVLTQRYDADTRFLFVTTDAEQFDLIFSGSELPLGTGDFTKTALKDDKAWAWSHGFDDNVYLKAAIAHFRERGWFGTLFLIGNIVEETREEDWIVDQPDLLRLLDEGWSIGGHSWEHACHGEFDYRQSIVGGYERLLPIITQSNRAAYRPIAFASPCFDTAYHPHVLALRDEGELPVMFDEGSGNFRILVDEAAAEDYTNGDKTAAFFTPDIIIGRDTRIEWELPSVIAELDWFAANASPERHFWYNTLTHGNNEKAVEEVLTYLEQNYGPKGTDEVWVAPSDEIYSYLLVRNHSQVTWELVE